MTARARTPEDLETPAIAAALRRLVGAHHTHGGHADSLVLRAPGRLGVVMGMRGGIKAHYPRFEAQP